jgi:addiction module RelE/StbE family toxin
MGKVIWTDKAVKHLKSIYEYIANDSETYASRFVDSLVRATLKLEKHSRIGRIVPEFEDTEYDFREVIYRGYRIIYQINKKEIEILAVINSRRDLETAIREDWEI